MSTVIAPDQKSVIAKRIQRAANIKRSNQFVNDFSEAQSSSYAYYMPRPMWAGFVNELIKDAGIDPTDLQMDAMSGGIYLSSPLSHEFMDKYEIVPVSMAALSQDAQWILSGTTGAAVLNMENTVAYSLTNIHLEPMLTTFNYHEASGNLVQVASEPASMPVAEQLVKLLEPANFGLRSLRRMSQYIDPASSAEFVFADALAIKAGAVRIDDAAGATPDDQLKAYFIKKQTELGAENFQALLSQWDDKALHLSTKFSVIPRRVMAIIDAGESAVSAPVMAPSATHQTATSVGSRKWVDLSAHGIYVGERVLPSNKKTVLMLVDMDAKHDPAALESIGFMPLNNDATNDVTKGVYILRGDDQSLKVKAIREALNLQGGIRVVETTTDAIRSSLADKLRERYQVNMDSLIMKATPLGTNYLGHEVLESVQGRFIREKESGLTYLETTTGGKRFGRAAFLLADDAKSLRLVADGLVVMMRQGRRFKSADLSRFATIAFRDHLGSDENGPVKAASDKQIFALQEALEAATYRSFLNQDDTLSHDAFVNSKTVYYAQPTANIKTAEAVNLQQYSTPLPMSIIAQRLMFGNDEIAGKSVLEPTAGNGGLLIGVPKNVSIGAIELDEKRLAAINELNHPLITAVAGDAAELDYLRALNRTEPFDYSITNPPFGKMPEAKQFDVLPNVAKYDHYIPLKSLAARKDVGRTVIILGADSPRSDGSLIGTSQHLMNYLSHYYELEAAVEVDGRLYSRQGSSFNVRMIVVGDRRAVPDPTIVAPTKLPIISDYDALWDWSSEVINDYGHLKHASPATPAVDVVVDAPTELERLNFELTALIQEAVDLGIDQQQIDDQMALLDASDAASVKRIMTSVDELLTQRLASSIDQSINRSFDAIGKAGKDTTDVSDEVSIAPSPQVDLPWKLTKAEWSAEWKSITTQPSSVTSRDRAEWLAYDVHSWVKERISIHETGEVVLSDAELQALQAQLDSPVTHRDVIDKALGEGKSVPAKVLADYPEFAVNNRDKNEFQVPYQAQSKLGESVGMIPINMASSTYDALRDLVNEHGDIDDYVATKLQYSLDELGTYFSPEQIDALALSIRSVEQGRGMINADQTGMGKGRWVAGMLRYAKLHDIQPIFSTIKPELFTDIFRDIADIGSSELFKSVFIFNDNVSIKKFGTEKEVLFKATSSADRKKAMAQGGFDEGDRPDLILTTYSQFQRAPEKNPKTKLLHEISKGGMLLLDESHIASGASNSGMAMAGAVASSAGVMYSSSTPLKGVKNFSIYSKIFPKSVDVSNLADTLSAGGESLMEAISANMARDGVLIRREHDLSQLEFKSVFPDSNNEQRNIDMANQFGAIMSRMAYMSGDINSLAAKLNKQFKIEFDKIPEKDRVGGRLQAESMNFGSRFFAINRQFLLGIKTQASIDQAILAISEGRKPVIAVENTGESLTRTIIAKRFGLDTLARDIEELENVADQSPEQVSRLEQLKADFALRSDNLSIDTPPQFRELLLEMLERMRMVKVQGGYGDVSYKSPESDEFNNYYEETKELIQQFPDMSLTPLDDIKNALSVVGYTCGEVSGRGVSLKHNPLTKKLDVINHPKHDAVSEVAAFQNGRYDAMIITRAGSTGISLHATNRNPDSDTRQREMIVLQKAANIADYLQWLGRVNRKDQVVTPIITSVESGLPAETRLTMMHNAKLRQMAANTTSNRDSANLENLDADFLNVVGDQVAEAWFMANPDIADLFQVDLSSDSDNLPECFYINRLMSRIAMIPSVEQQSKIIDIIGAQFKERLEELIQQGINPFKVDVHEWNAEVVASDELDASSIETSSSSFDEPVTLVTVQYEKEVKPLRADEVADIISANLTCFKHLADVDESTARPTILRDHMLAVRDMHIREALPTKIQMSDLKIDTILRQSKEDDYRGAKQVQQKADWLIANVTAMHPGRIVTFINTDGQEKMGVITNVRLADDDKLFLTGQYSFDIAIPGESRLHNLTAGYFFGSGTRLTDGAFTLWNSDADSGSPMSKRLHEAFDNAPDGRLTFTKNLLQGNTYRACELAALNRMGHAVLYTNKDGERVRAVMLNHGVSLDMVKSIPVALTPKHAAVYCDKHLERYGKPTPWADKQGVTLYSVPVMGDAANLDDVVSIKMTSSGYTISIPGTKSKSGGIFADGSITKNGKETNDSLSLDFVGNRTSKIAKIEANQLGVFLERMMKGGHVERWYVGEQDKLVFDDTRDYFADLKAGSKQSERIEPAGMMTP